MNPNAVQSSLSSLYKKARDLFAPPSQQAPPVENLMQPQNLMVRPVAPQEQTYQPQEGGLRSAVSSFLAAPHGAGKGVSDILGSLFNNTNSETNQDLGTQYMSMAVNANRAGNKQLAQKYFQLAGGQFNQASGYANQNMQTLTDANKNKFVSDVGKTSLMGAGAVVSPASVPTSIALGGGISAGIAALQKKDPYAAFGQGAAQGLEYNTFAPVAQGVNARLFGQAGGNTPAIQGVLAKATPAIRYAVAGIIGSGTALTENEIISRIGDHVPTPEERKQAAIIGAITGVGSQFVNDRFAQAKQQRLKQNASEQTGSLGNMSEVPKTDNPNKVPLSNQDVLDYLQGGRDPRIVNAIARRNGFDGTITDLDAFNTRLDLASRKLIDSNVIELASVRPSDEAMVSGLRQGGTPKYTQGRYFSSRGYLPEGTVNVPDAGITLGASQDRAIRGTRLNDLADLFDAVNHGNKTKAYQILDSIDNAPESSPLSQYKNIVPTMNQLLRGSQAGAIDPLADVSLGATQASNQVAGGNGFLANLDKAMNTKDFKTAGTILDAIDSAPSDSPLAQYKNVVPTMRMLMPDQGQAGFIDPLANVGESGSPKGPGSLGASSQPPDANTDFPTQMDQYMADLGAKNNPTAQAVSDISGLSPKERVKSGVGVDVPLTDPTMPPSSDQFNVDTYNLSPAEKLRLSQTADALQPQIEKITGQKMSNQSIVDLAQNTSKVLDSTVGQEQTQSYAAALLKARQQLAAMARTGQVTPEYIDTLLTIKSNQTNIARLLQSQSISADPVMANAQNQIISAVSKAGVSTDDILSAAKGVDFNDPQEASIFYRQFVKPTANDWIDLIRYNSMLSSPKTLANIGAGSFLNTSVVAPVTHGVAGAVDFVSSRVTGQDQQHFMGEAPAYSSGYISSLHDAFTNMVNVFKGTQEGGSPDVSNIQMYPDPTTLGNKVENSLGFFSKLHQGLYSFFNTLAQGGEESALNYRVSQGGTVPDVTGSAADAASYYSMRQGLNPEGQGGFLNAIDQVVGLVKQAKNSDNGWLAWPAKFSFPFLNIANNMVKQGIEYSPAGVLTVPGSSDKITQASKALIGTTLFATAASLASSGNITGAEPTSQKEKAAFLSAGRQPYSIKIGDTWVGYSKLPPALGVPLSLASAYVDAQARGVNTTVFDKLLATAGKQFKYFSDQSVVKNMGDLMSALQGDTSKWYSLTADYANQFFPYRAFFGWLATATDPYKRQLNPDVGKLEKQFQAFLMQVPLARQSLPARVDLSGNPIPASHPILNSINPFPVSDVNQTQEQVFQNYEEVLKNRAIQTKAKKENAPIPDNGIGVQAFDGTPSTISGDSMANLEQKYFKISSQRAAQIKQNVKDNIPVSESDLVAAYLGKDIILPKDGTYNNAVRTGKLFANVDSITNNQYLTEPQKQLLLDTITKKAGVSKDDLAYYDTAKQNNDLKSIYANEQVSKLMTSGAKPNDIYDWLLNNTRSINGNKVLTPGVIDSLVSQNIISKSDGTFLKGVQVTGSGPTRQIRVPKMPRKLQTVRTVKTKRIRTIKLKPISVRLR